MHTCIINKYYRIIMLMALVSYSVLALAAPGDRATPVMVGAAHMEHLAPQTWVAGTVISRHQARLAAEVEGKLIYVAEVGTQVAEDAVVARIDPTFIKLKVEEYAAAAERDLARLDFLKGEVQRLKRLAMQSNTSQTLLDQTRAEREVARNEFLISRTKLKLAREEKRRHEIRTPFAGVVMDRLMRRGEWAGAGDHVLEVVDSRELEIQARVPLSTLDFVHEGDLLTIKVNGKELQTKVRALVAAGDERSRLLDLRLALTDNGWTIGQPVRIALPTAIAKEVLVVSRDALVLRRDGAAVFRINAENMAERIAVQLGVASGALVEVHGDIKAGDRVVTRGGERLRPGAMVKILNADQTGNKDVSPAADKSSDISKENSNEKSNGK